ncbi:MAG: ArsR family transcriptional regulator [Natronomonas sp.]
MEDIGTLSSVLEKRSELLRTLAEGPRTQRALRDELGVSRSTVYKSLRELEAEGLVAEGTDRYRLTPFGRLAWRRHNDYRVRLARLDRTRELLSAIPESLRLPLSLFEQGRIVFPTRSNPERPLNRMSELGERADRLRCVSPAGIPRYLSNIHDRVEADEQTATLVVEPDALHQLEAGYDEFEAATAADGLRIRVVEERLSTGVVLFDDDAVGLFVYEGGALIGSVFGSTPGAVAWGESLFKDIDARSTRV